MTRCRRRLAALALAAATASCETVATVDDAPPTMLSIRGKISAGMIDQFATLMPNGAGGAVVHLASGGGDFDTALQIARRLEALPRSTAVVTRSCDSACVLIFLAARERLVAPAAVISVHRPQCIVSGLPGVLCGLFWEPWARAEFHARIARVSPPWAAYLDDQDPPAFARHGADFVRVTGAQLIAFGVASPYTREALSARLRGE
ncbi:MAG: hypothetical protein HY060_09465 [Proteobacteria bacterium]|nr:hypothetical protein [Pseudomonadota bacterium]